MKIAVVTGASSGMGREFVRQIGFFYRNLDEIWVFARRKERLERLRNECRVPLRVFDGDLLKKQVYRQYSSELKEKNPDIRMLVNAAGFGKSGSFSVIASEGKKLQPEMVGIGPFIPHHDTPFKGEPQGGLELTLYLLSLIRLLLPRVLLPATTALGTIDPMGREMGVLAGANVVMPNLSPENVREKYLLYDNKIHTGKEAAECLDALRESMKAIGYDVVVDRGDFLREDMK